MVLPRRGGSLQVKQYPQGHSPSNYGRWVGAAQPYPVKYKKVGGGVAHPPRVRSVRSVQRARWSSSGAGGQRAGAPSLELEQPGLGTN